MALELINLGSAPDAGDGDQARTAFGKANDNFAEVKYFTNVMEHGAVGDGSTDDSVAIQAAIDAVNTAGGGVVYVPEGIYVCQSIELTSRSPIGILKVSPAVTAAELDSVSCPRYVPAVEAVHRVTSVYVSVAATSSHSTAAVLLIAPVAATEPNVACCLSVSAATLAVPAAPGAPMWSCTQTAALPLYAVPRA